MAGDRNNVPILFSKSQVKNNPKCFFCTALTVAVGLYRSGIRNVNRVSAGDEMTSILPPWARAISEAMYSRSIASDGIGSPALATDNSNLPSCAVARADRLFGRAVSHRIAKQVGAVLRDATAVAVDRPGQIEGCLDFSSGRAGAKFHDHLVENRLQ